MVIICVVGDMPYENEGFQSKIVSALHQIPIRMISYGGSDYNISFLIHEKDKKQALSALSNVLFN
jgi:aspartate kinase